MQKVIVSDTSCIGYLIQINLLKLLQIIYGEIIIPEAVHEEILQLKNREHDLSEFKNANWIKRYRANNLSNAKNKNLIISIKDALDKVILLGCRINEKLYNIALKSCNEL